MQFGCKPAKASPSGKYPAPRQSLRRAHLHSEPRSISKRQLPPVTGSEGGNGDSLSGFEWGRLGGTSRAADRVPESIV